MEYSLKEHKVTFSTDFKEIRVVKRNDGLVVDKAMLDKGEVELWVDGSYGCVELRPLSDGLPEPYHEVMVELRDTTAFGLDSLMMGGIGISDLRDTERVAHVFDLKRCRMTYSREVIEDGYVMVMRGKAHDTTDEGYYWTVVRDGIGAPE